MAPATPPLEYTQDGAPRGACALDAAIRDLRVSLGAPIQPNGGGRRGARAARRSEWARKRVRRKHPPQNRRNAIRQFTEIARNMPAGGTLHGPTFTAPILNAVLAAPPEGWPADLLSRLSWLHWQMQQVTDARHSMDHWQQAKSTAKAPDQNPTAAAYQRAEGMFRKQVRAALVDVREVLPLLESRTSWCSAVRGAVTRLWRRAPHAE
jgi:hypothetical protein